MTAQELKKALFKACPVVFNGIEYQRVCEIVYRRPANEVIVSAGLMDKNGNSITYALPEKVSFADEAEGNREVRTQCSGDDTKVREEESNA